MEGCTWNKVKLYCENWKGLILPFLRKNQMTCMEFVVFGHPYCPSASPFMFYFIIHTLYDCRVGKKGMQTNAKKRNCWSQLRMQSPPVFWQEVCHPFCSIGISTWTIRQVARHHPADDQMVIIRNAKCQISHKVLNLFNPWVIEIVILTIVTQFCLITQALI